MLPPRGVSTAHRTRTNFVRVGDLPNVIIHAKFEINLYKIVSLAKGWSFMFQHYTAEAINMAKPCRAACDTSPRTRGKSVKYLSLMQSFYHSRMAHVSVLFLCITLFRQTDAFDVCCKNFINVVQLDLSSKKLRMIKHCLDKTERI